MANNRMYIACMVCLENDNTPYEDCIFYLSKYYPTGGWQSSAQVSEELNRFFQTHLHREFEDYMWGDIFAILTEVMLGNVPKNINGKLRSLYAIENNTRG